MRTIVLGFAVVLWAVALWAVAPPFVQAQQVAKPSASLTAIVTNSVPALIEAGGLALAVGVIRGEDQYSAGFGRMSPEDDTAPNADTAFGIGSISKGFTGILLADAVARGDAKLDQAVAELLPADWDVPSFKPKNEGAPERPITLKQLASHTAGLARLPGNLFPAKDPSDPYAHYKMPQLRRGVESIVFRSPPGTRSEYSNFGAGLLGVALARTADKPSYEDLLRERVLVPLAMTNTWIEPSPERLAHLAPGYDEAHQAQKLWAMPMFEGAGAIRSTANDMLKLLRAELASDGTLDAPLEAALAGSRKPVKKIPSGHIGLGWHRARDGSTWWHNGQTYGYHAYAAFNREFDVAVVVLATGHFAQIDAFGEHLVRQLAGSVPADQAFVVKRGEKDLQLGADVLDRYVGEYKMPLGPTFVIKRVGGQLQAKLGEQPTVPVYARSEVTFVYKVVDATLIFDKEGKMLTLLQNGRAIPAKRIEPAPAAKAE